MASRIRITPQELTSSSRIFMKGSTETTRLLSSLNKEVTKLQSSWEGAAQNTFVQEYRRLEPSLKEFTRVLEGISKQLSEVAATMERVDREIASKLRK